MSAHNSHDSACVAAKMPIPTVARHSPLSQVPARSFSETRPFSCFGLWGKTVRVAELGAEYELVRWMALYRRTADSYEELWEHCRHANPHCFTEYRIVNLARPSFFLPAGEVVFKVIENPTQIPDHPPCGVMMRHMEAMDAFPAAKFFFLRPVFIADPYSRLYTGDDLRMEALSDFEILSAKAQLRGWAFRAAVWTERRLIDLARWTVRGATAAVETIDYLLASEDWRRLKRLARSRPAFESRRDLVSLASRADRLGLSEEARAFRRAALRLQSRFEFDPVLCFEVSSRPGQLWFEAHWYQGQDGRTYVHY